jgi:hypothetical protein
MRGAIITDDNGVFRFREVSAKNPHYAALGTSLCVTFKADSDGEGTTHQVVSGTRRSALSYLLGIANLDIVNREADRAATQQPP